MRIMRILLLSVFLLLAQQLSCQVVNTQYGQVEGMTIGNVYRFLGVPYAKPPIGNLRWKPPVAPDAWTGIRSATSYAECCPYCDRGIPDDIVQGNEDCLYLNIWSPNLTGSLPVMFYIHGGANQEGCNTDPIMDGKNLAERGNVVVVSINYRIGPLGFLVHPGLEIENSYNTSGNYGLLDQIMALQWVKDNIANFGGDPNKVMIFGCSAGGLDVGTLILSPLASNLFQRAAMQSPAPGFFEYQDLKNYSINYINGYINSGTDAEKISYARNLPLDTLLWNMEPSIIGGVVTTNWGPVNDGYVLPSNLIESIQSGNFNHVPLIIGSTANELGVMLGTITPNQVIDSINSLIPQQYIPLALQLYAPGDNNEEARESLIKMLADMQFTAPARRFAKCINENQEQPVWRYFLTYVCPIPYFTSAGAYHGMDQYYIFNTFENSVPPTDFTLQDDSMQNNMLNYWVNFAYSGNPNGQNLVNWPQFDALNDCYLEIKATPNGSNCGIRTAECNLWDSIVGFTGCSEIINEIIGNNLNNDFSIFPNPTDGIVYLKYNTNDDYNIFINDPMGRLVSTYHNTPYVDLHNLSDGVYYFTIISDKVKIIKKIILQNKN